MFLLFFLLNLFTEPELLVKSPAFAHTHYIPLKYTCSGENFNPALRIENISRNTKSFALILVDSSAAFGIFDHWVMWNIPPDGLIAENSAPGKQGWNSRKENKYTGPCPPNGIHEYRFRVYALSRTLELPDSTDKDALLKAIQPYVLARGELIGLFQK